MLEQTERTTTPMKPIMCASPNNLDDFTKKKITAKQSNRRNRRRIRNPPEMLIFFRCLIDAPFAIIKLKMRHCQQDMKYETPKYPLQMFRSTPLPPSARQGYYRSPPLFKTKSPDWPIGGASIYTASQRGMYKL